MNFQPKRRLERLSDSNKLETFVDESSLYVPKEIGLYDFLLYTKTQDGYLYWVDCLGNSETSYDCFRTIEFGDMNICYSIHKNNIENYKGIDDFIFEHLSMWQCN